MSSIGPPAEIESIQFCNAGAKLLPLSCTKVAYESERVSGVFLIVMPANRGG